MTPTSFAASWNNWKPHESRKISDLFATLVKQRSGLVLTREKAYLLESRLLPVSRKYNLKSLEEMAQLVRSRRDEAMMGDIAEAMTTNESFFFRDRKPFAQFRDTSFCRNCCRRARRKGISASGRPRRPAGRKPIRSP